MGFCPAKQDMISVPPATTTTTTTTSKHQINMVDFINYRFIIFTGNRSKEYILFDELVNVVIALWFER